VPLSFFWWWSSPIERVVIQFAIVVSMLSAVSASGISVSTVRCGTLLSTTLELSSSTSGELALLLCPERSPLVEERENKETKATNVLLLLPGAVFLGLPLYYGR
jgi:hypothetical protein